MLPTVAACCGDKHVLPVCGDVSLLHHEHLHLVLATEAAKWQLTLHLLWNSLEVQGQCEGLVYP